MPWRVVLYIMFSDYLLISGTLIGGKGSQIVFQGFGAHSQFRVGLVVLQVILPTLAVLGALTILASRATR